MNEYIINPSWFYWISVLDTLKAVLLVAAILLVIVTFSCGYSAIGLCDDEEAAKLKQHAKQCAVAVAVCLVACIFIPSKKVLIEMMIAKYATYENAQITADALKSAVDYIIEAIKSVK